jgi:hypothetical protein
MPLFEGIFYICILEILFHYGKCFHTGPREEVPGED